MTVVQSASKTILPTVEDFYLCDDEFLDDEERLVRDSARQFCRKELLPHIRAWDAGDIKPYARKEDLTRDVAVKLARALNVFGATLPEMGKYLDASEFVPMTPAGYGLVMREIEAVDTSLRSLASVQSSLGLFAVYTFGSEEVKRKWLPLLYRGEKLVCFGLTEPQGGSDPASMKTTAEKTARGWVLDGTKVWITNGFADLAVVWARTGDGIRGFLVENGAPGFTVRHEEKWALRAGTASSLTFNRCEVPDANLLPGSVQEPPNDLKCPLRCLSEARFSIIWGAVGAARACVEEVLEFVKNRNLFGRPLASKQAMVAKLVWCLNEVENMSLVAHRIASLKAKGRLHYAHISLAKYNNADKSVKVAQESVDMLPADVFTFEAYHSGRHLRNLQIIKKYEGTHEIHTLMVGRALTGLSAF
ncbi:MAG: acyl-CoA dehydrogenase family protein [Elusimicrobia bacterium]|nr:acyl-CoA dehydrogenase family protein [Elusimicrobiota bacterium]